MIDTNELWNERRIMNPNEGLPLALFEWISSVTPIPNVDLLIVNENGEILLSWRDDEYYGKGWHLPGGCIRFKETIAERIQKTALNELGTNVIVGEQPIVVKDMIMGIGKDEPCKRAHHVAMLFECRLPHGYEVNNSEKKEQDAGYLRWFKNIPNNTLSVHHIYDEEFRKRGLLKEKETYG